MTIEKIDISIKRQGALEKEKEAEEERKIYEEMCKDFNQEAKKRNSSYRMLIAYLYPHLYLIKRWFFNLFEERKELNQIHYNKNDYMFSFINGLDEKVFKDIEPILNNIDTKFEIFLKSGEVPTKYKILKSLQ